jgi:4-alpha-glucanotransferase
LRRQDLKSGHGVCITLPGLHSHFSAGIGEFLDMLPLIDWCEAVGMEVIQLLPINDSGNDPSPYNPISSCALNPLYLSIAVLPNLPKDLREEVHELQALNRLFRISFHTVRRKKMDWLYRYYQINGDLSVKTPAFQKFIAENEWVTAYAAYKDQRAQMFHIFLQFLCFQQMKQVKDYANRKNIFIMGDIPILMSGSSEDVQNNSQFFNTELLAGAPPDPYNQEGQCWGFPLYNWEAMKEDDYRWWKQRLRVASQIYDLFRIDHIVGLFRIWAVPMGTSPKEGFFVPADPSLWMDDGRERLEMILRASPMLPIGEDLGTVSAEVRHLMAELGICGTKVVRWERHWKTDRSFIPFEAYPVLSLTTLSTHDSEPLALWWQKQREEAEAFAHFKHWTYTPELSSDQRSELLRDSHQTPSLLHINLLQEYLALFPSLVWPHLEDERINIPGVLHPYNWLYRYRPSLEEMLSHDKLNEKIKSLF